MDFERFKRKIQPAINIYHLVKAVIANVLYGFPSRKLKVIGVTGTDGKTTTAHLIYHILKLSGKKASLISSIYAKIGDEEFTTGLHTTTPDSLAVQKYLKQAVVNGDGYFILETTSHALDQNRIFGVRFLISVITNITPEHLDYHKTYDNYMRAKAKLLLSSETPIINRDDKSFPPLEKLLVERGKNYRTYGLHHKADFSVNFGKVLKLPLSKFNAYNYLAAYSVASTLGFAKQKISDALKTFTLPQGRMEKVYDKDFTVVIDFAHTANSLNQVLGELKNGVKNSQGRLIHVFGAAGLRDYQKRPAMGEASASHSDVVILTEEDYRTEDPEVICEEISEGLIKKGFRYVGKDNLDSGNIKVYTLIVNRKEAIKKAIQIAKKGDIVVTTGKSHEQSLARGKKEYPWDEKKAVMEALRERFTI